VRKIRLSAKEEVERILLLSSVINMSMDKDR
jgi:hypothetical protein